MEFIAEIEGRVSDRPIIVNIFLDPKSSPQRPPNATLKFGDIALTAEQEDAYRRGRITFNAVIGQHLRWKDAIIPYNIDCSIGTLYILLFL